MAKVKKTAMSEYDKSRREGFIAIALRDGDELVRVVATSGEDDVVMVSLNGSGIRFSETDVRPMGRDAAGVRGMRLRAGDEVLGNLYVTEKDGAAEFDDTCATAGLDALKWRACVAACWRWANFLRLKSLMMRAT